MLLFMICEEDTGALGGLLDYQVSGTINYLRSDESSSYYNLFFE